MTTKSQKVIVQFSYRNSSSVPDGLPVVDCRSLPNPYQRYTKDEDLKNTVRQLPGFEGVVHHGMQLIAQHDIIYIGCAYGKHRSGAVAEELAARTGASIIKQNFGV
jgi:RNase adaptor protein for sRNA GlmZ degradation